MRGDDMNNVFVLGSLNIDSFIELERFPNKGETVLGSDVVTAYGGKGANQALASQKLGSKAHMIGCVGTDLFGNKMIQNLLHQGVNVDNIQTKEGSSGAAIIYLAEGDNQIVVSRGTNSLITVEDVTSALANAKENDYFVSQFEVPISVVEESIKYARKKQLITLLNPSPFQDFDMKVLQYVDILVVNEYELKQLTEKLSFEELIATVDTVVCTYGSKGSKAYKNVLVYCHAGFKVDTVDTTAAGDSFIGGFLAKYKSGDIEEVLEFANAAGALATTKKGAQPSIPSQTEVEQLIKKAR